jgi:hypothetical protein
MKIARCDHCTKIYAPLPSLLQYRVSIGNCNYVGRSHPLLNGDLQFTPPENTAQVFPKRNVALTLQDPGPQRARHASFHPILGRTVPRGVNRFQVQRRDQQFPF